MLEQGRYTWRHDSVLNILFQSLKLKTSNSDIDVFCDLPEQYPGISTIPNDIIITNQKPDIVILDRKNRKVTLVELTIPFERNINKAQIRKEDRYKNLVSDISEKDYDTKLITFELSSRGVLSAENNIKLRDILTISEPPKRKELNNIVNILKKTVILASYCIFYSKFEKSWVDPALIEL